MYFLHFKFWKNSPQRHLRLGFTLAKHLMMNSISSRDTRPEKFLIPSSGQLSKVYLSSKCSNLSAHFLLALCYISPATGLTLVRNHPVSSLLSQDYLYFLRRRQWHPTPILLPGKSHGRRGLEGCSPWGCQESDTTEATQQQQQQYFLALGNCFVVVLICECYLL